jgi:hypothetical protein
VSSLWLEFCQELADKNDAGDLPNGYVLPLITRLSVAKVLKLPASELGLLLTRRIPGCTYICIYITEIMV